MKKTRTKERIHRKKGVKKVKKPVKSHGNVNAWVRGGINE